jgi:RNA-directed DNA polymerase
LSFILYKLSPVAKYQTFTIPKKGGGTRQIDAPTPQLKALQRRLANVLYDCLQSIEEKEKRKNTLSRFAGPIPSSPMRDFIEIVVMFSTST